jgi:hypothetical protein
MVQRFFVDPDYARAYFIAPATDNSVVSAFTLNAEANDIVNDDPAHTSAYTIDNSLGKKQVPVTASYVYLPGDYSDPGDNILLNLNTEICQSWIQGFATAENKFKNYAASILGDTSVQESVCNTLAIALTAVQRHMSKKKFMATYANPDNIIPLEGGAPAATIPLSPWIYDVMTKIKPAIAVAA